MRSLLKTQLKLLAAMLVLTAAPLAFAQPDDQDGPPPGPPEEEMNDDGPPRDRQGFREEMRRHRREMRDGSAAGAGQGRSAGMGQRGEGREGRREGRGEGREGLGGGRIGRYLEVVQKYQTAVQDSGTAVGLAALGIKEQYRRLGKPEVAVKELEPMLQSTTDQKMRNILLFAIRQTYEESRNHEKFLEINRQIIKENLGAK